MVLIQEIVPLFLLSSVKSKNMGSIRLFGKKVMRDFLFVTDFVHLIYKIFEDFPKRYNLYNIGYGMIST